MAVELTVETVKTYERIARKYHSIHKNPQEIAWLLDRFLKMVKGKKVLDIGCGNGRDTKYMSEKGFDVTGIDLSSNMLKIAEKFAPKAKFYRMDMRKIGFKDKSFDGLWALSSFMHIPKSQAYQTLEEFRRVLKDDGIMLVSVPEGKGEKFVKKESYEGGKKFFAFYRVGEFKSLLEKAGFEVCEIVKNGAKDKVWINFLCRKTYCQHITY